MSKSRAYTNDEVREMFLRYVWGLIDYWETIRPGEKTMRERLSGCVFSLLATLDGDSPALPGFLVIPSPHVNDKAYLRKNGENWFPYPPGPRSDIGGCLHELFYRLDTKKETKQ
jgi:hypothetical protein